MLSSVLVQRDQWTVTGRFDIHRPLLRVLFADKNGNAGDTLYLSSATGEVVQQTTAPERFWNAPGAVSHWLYLTALRRNGELWSAVVVWASVATLVLLAIGTWLGLRALRWRKLPTARATTYRGALRWHHLASAVCAVLLLTWTLSGLLSMNPWGLLQSGSYAAEQERLRWLKPGGGVPTNTPLSSIARAALDRAPADTVAIKIAPFAGRISALAFNAEGSVTRLDAEGNRRPLERRELETAASTLRADAQPTSLHWLELADAYYYSHHTQRAFPVLRATMDDPQHTRYYLDPTSGELLLAVDRSGRLYRWLHNGLHRLDFTASLRTRPLWDAILLGALAGCTMAALTGIYAGVSRLRRWRR